LRVLFEAGEKRWKKRKGGEKKKDRGTRDTQPPEIMIARTAGGRDRWSDGE